MKILRRVAVGFLGLLMTAGIWSVATPEASAFSYGRSRVTHHWTSEREWIITATEYNGRGHRSEVQRRHRLPAEAGKIRSVWVPKGCTIVTNGWAYQTSWLKGSWANIGKVPYRNVKLKMDCGFVKQWTG